MLNNDWHRNALAIALAGAGVVLQPLSIKKLEAPNRSSEPEDSPELGPLPRNPRILRSHGRSHEMEQICEVL